jgi:hypothetical protein
VAKFKNSSSALANAEKDSRPKPRLSAVSVLWVATNI